MQTSAVTRPRLFEADLTPVEYTVPFNGNDYIIHLQITAFGEVVSQATDFVSLLTKHPSIPAGEHFRKLVARCPDLDHKNQKLRDYVQVQ